MAVQSGNTTDKKQDSMQGKVVDPFAAKLRTGVAKVINLNNPDDAWTRSAPPPKGYYDLKLYVAKEGYRERHTDEKNPTDENLYYSVNLECHIQSDDPDLDDRIFFENVTTKVNRGKDISTLAALMVKMGKNPVPKGQTEVTDLDQLQKFAKWIKEEPIVRTCLVDWKFSYLDEKTNRWHNVCRTYEDFPDSDTGDGKQFEIAFTKPDGSRDVGQAKLYVAEWGGKEAKDVSNLSSNGRESTKPKAVATVVVEDTANDDEIVPTPTRLAPPKPTAKSGTNVKGRATNVVVTDDDMVEDL